MEEENMLQALIGDHWRQIEILDVERYGVTVMWHGKLIRKRFDQIRWISDDWYVTQRRVVA